MAKRVNGVTEFTLSGSSLSWTFPKLGALTIDAADFYPAWATFDDVQQKIVLNGLKQKCADSIASATTEIERHEKMKTVMTNLLNGVWAVRSTGTTSDAAILAQAISEVDRKPLSNVREYVDGLSKAAREALMAHPLYKGTCDKIKAQRAQDVDIEGELAAIRNL